MKDDYKKENPDVQLMGDKFIKPSKNKLVIKYLTDDENVILPLPKPKKIDRFIYNCFAKNDLTMWNRLLLFHKKKKMSNKPLHIGEEAAVQMPMKTVVSLIIIVALGTMGYFQIIERLNIADTRLQLMEKDLGENTEFRIKWPRGQLGSLPADSEQYMLIEDLYKQVEKLQENIEMNMSNKLKIEFMEGQISKLLTDVEELKDANREIVYKNGTSN